MPGPYGCLRCGGTFESTPEAGFCPKCPDEPVFDLSTAEGREVVESAEEEAESRRRGRADTIGLVIGIVVGLVLAGLVLAVPFVLVLFDIEPGRLLEAVIHLSIYLCIFLVLGCAFAGRVLGAKIYGRVTGQDVETLSFRDQFGGGRFG